MSGDVRGEVFFGKRKRKLFLLDGKRKRDGAYTAVKKIFALLERESSGEG